MADADEIGSTFIDASREAAREFDSRIFWLAGGSIGLSLTFCQGLIKSGAVIRLPLLVWGWGALIASIAIVMTSFQLTIHQCNAFALYEQGDRSSRDEYDRGQRYSLWVTRFNWAALAATILGLALVCAFNASLPARP